MAELAEIRPARSQDVEAVVSLWREFMAHQEGPEPRFRRAPEAEARFREIARAALEPGPSRFLVAAKGGQIVGYTLGRVASNPPTLSPPRYGYVAELFVRPEERGQGLGRRLYQALGAWFQEQGVTSVQLRVLATNREGQRFWRALGFTDFMDILWRGLP